MKKRARKLTITTRLAEASALGDRLRALRDEKGVSNAALAQAMGIDESTLGQILAGDIARPPDRRLRGAARLLGVSFESLKTLLPGELREALAGSKWLVRVIRSGRSENGIEYPPSTLREAVPLFAGTRVYATSDREHVAGDPADVRNLVGRLVDPRYVAQGDRGEIQAVFELIHPEGEFGQWLAAAHERGMGDMFGLSLRAVGRVRNRTARELVRVASVDFIISPAAGGRILSLIESTRGTSMPTKTRKQLLAEARAKVKGSKLPKRARRRLKAQLETATDLTEAAVDRLIRDERTYLTEALSDVGLDAGTVRGLGDGHIGLVEGREDRIPKMLDALLDPEDRSMFSLKEAYIELTGDKRVTGDMRHVDSRKLSEAISVGSGTGAGVFAQLFGDSIARRMQNMYAMTGVYDWYKKVCTEVPVTDFREQKRPYWGGYGDLPTVAQAAAYTDLTSPTDVEEVYTPTKRGGIEKISLESIKNDDIGVVMRIPGKLAMAAKRTLSAHIAGIFTMNSGAGPTLNADSLHLFHTTHGNLATAALAKASVAAARIAMVKQQERDSNKIAGVMPRFLLVPWELQEVAYDLFARGTNNDPTFVNSLGFETLPVPEWTDTNDWVLTADPMMIETIEIGYLDGMMEPEIFLQDSEHYGSMFSNDQWSYKIRHIYGATPMDYRGLYKANVT